MSLLGVRYATARGTFTREYRCDHCGHAATARAVGGGYAQAGSVGWYVDGVRAKANSEAERAAEQDAVELISLAACPSCGKRDRAAWRNFARGSAVRSAGVGALFALMLVLVFVTNDDDVLAPALCLLLIGAFAVVMVAFVRKQRAEVAAGRVVFQPLEPPARSDPEVRGAPAHASGEGVTRTRQTRRRPS